MSDLEQDIWSEHLEEINKRKEEMTIQPGEKSIAMFMEETGLTRDQARAYLEKMTSTGRLRKRKLPCGIVVYTPLTDA